MPRHCTRGSLRHFLRGALRRLFPKSFHTESEPNHRPKFASQFETLEERQLLTAAGFENPLLPQYPCLVVEEDLPAEPVTVQGIHLKVNGEEKYVDATDARLSLNQGDSLEVVSLDLSVGQGLQSTEGVFAVEGYLHKLDSTDQRSQIDYSDGRFSSRESNAAVATGKVVQGGLSEGWTVENGWDRLTLSVVHYFGDQSSREATASILLEVGQPDFSFGHDIFQVLSQPVSVGDQVEIMGSWLNLGEGRYHNYAEVDIYFEEESSPHWVGVLAGNADQDQPVSGEFLFPTENGDQFTERWIPERAGSYRVEFTVDPEQTWQEADEQNNRLRFNILVGEPGEEVQLGNLGRGVVGQDRARGEGFILYSQENVHDRFQARKIHPRNADHFVTVRYHEGEWQYDTNQRYVPFQPHATDVLVSRVDFTQNRVQMLDGQDAVYHDIQLGYAGGDLFITPDSWNNRWNPGEFGLSGSHIRLHQPSRPQFEVDVSPIAVSEVTPTGSHLGQIDFSGNRPLEFSVIQGDPNQHFQVDTAGQLLLNRELDFEQQNRFQLLVQATDGEDIRLIDWSVSVEDSWQDGEVALGRLGRGVAARDHASGDGFLMFSRQNVHDRFASSRILKQNADHLIAVKLIDGTWHFDNNQKYIAFTPETNDLLIAKVDFSDNRTEVLKGVNSQLAGIPMGVADTDMEIQSEQWGKQKNRGEFFITGTSLQLHRNA